MVNSTIQKYVGIPIKSKNCWQFICDFYSDVCGLKLKEFEIKRELKEKKEKAALSRFLDAYLHCNEWERITKPEYPDIVMFNISGMILHGGIVVCDEKMLHMQVSGSTVETYTSKRWTGRTGSLNGFYRYVGGAK